MSNPTPRVNDDAPQPPACPHCDGDGAIATNTPCPFCKGSGRAPAPTLRDDFKALREAGGKAWDDVADPAALLGRDGAEDAKAAPAAEATAAAEFEAWLSTVENMNPYVPDWRRGARAAWLAAKASATAAREADAARIAELERVLRSVEWAMELQGVPKLDYTIGAIRSVLAGTSAALAPPVPPQDAGGGGRGQG